jgi:hypothetical protein
VDVKACVIVVLLVLLIAATAAPEHPQALIQDTTAQRGTV